MTPLERAARALARNACPPGGEAQFPYVSSDEWEEKNWRDHVSSARAVLLALREPSEGMEDAAGNRDTIGYDPPPSVVWRAMIDAALEEG